MNDYRNLITRTQWPQEPKRKSARGGEKEIIAKLRRSGYRISVTDDVICARADGIGLQY